MPLTDEDLLESLAALEGAQGNKTLAAEALGIARSTLSGRLSRAHQRGLAARRFLDHIEARLSKARPLPVISRPLRAYKDMLSIYPITDAHIGQLSWGREVGKDYNVEIASENLRAGMSGLISATPESEHAVLLIMGDYTHNDDDTNETKRSHHKLDVDGRMHKVALSSADVAEGMAAMLLQHHRHVTTVVLPGNHDPNAYLITLAALRAGLKDNPRATVYDKPGPHWFHRFGSNIIAATHGHLVKMERMPDLVLTECREWVSECPHMYCYSGHIHQRKSFERSGVWCRSFSPATERDAYAFGGAYYSRRGISSVTHHRDSGFMLESFFPLG